MKKTTYAQLLDKVQQRSQQKRIIREHLLTQSGSSGRAPDYYPPEPDVDANMKIQKDIEERVKERVKAYSKVMGEVRSLRWSLPDGWADSPVQAVQVAAPVLAVKPPKTIMVNAPDLKGGEIAVAVTTVTGGFAPRYLKLPRIKVPPSPVGHWCSARDIVEIEVQEPEFNEWGENSL